jgi:hypothetical protein
MNSPFMVSDILAYIIRNKDFFGFVFGLAAFITSLITLRQKKYEVQRTLRSQITDVMGKLVSVGQEIEKFRNDHADEMEEHHIKVQLDLLERQNSSLAQQADYLASHIPQLVSEVEYRNIALAFDLASDYYKTEYYWLCAINSSLRGYKKEAMWYAKLRKAYNIRRYADFLAKEGNFKQALRQYNKSLELLDTEHDQVPGFSDLSVRLVFM